MEEKSEASTVDDNIKTINEYNKNNNCSRTNNIKKNAPGDND